MADITGIATGMDMRSAEFTLTTGNGRIAGVADTMPGKSANGPVVLIPPTFGRTIPDYGVVAWTLAANGFRVVRYDQTNHVGASDGEMLDFSPWTAITDMHAVLDHVTASLAPPSAGVVAFSLSFRFALRALADRNDVTLLLGAGAVVHMRATLAAALDDDYFGKLEDGTMSETAMALGHRIKRLFLSDAVELDLHTPESAVADAERLEAAIVVTVNEKDPWVRLADIRNVLGGVTRSRPTELVTIPAVAQHEIQRNPVAAATMLSEMVTACQRHLGSAGCEVVIPSLPQMARIQRAEAAAADLRLASV